MVNESREIQQLQRANEELLGIVSALAGIITLLPGAEKVAIEKAILNGAAVMSPSPRSGVVDGTARKTANAVLDLASAIRQYPNP